MSQSQVSLSWSSHTKSLSNGLSNFQQNGDFVDMTLAADGHFVKVHQVIIALSSPYIKDLLSSAPCPHPVLFLNNISYTTLCAILEYVYTGEVYVSRENLVELKLAATELHIKGLEDINIPQFVTSNIEQTETQNCQDMATNNSNMAVIDDNICFFEITNPRIDEDNDGYILPGTHKSEQDDSVSDNIENSYSFDIEQENLNDNNIEETDANFIKTELNEGSIESMITPLQYTVSNQGSLQMILNRYIYYLKHTNRNNKQQWRCVDYLSNNKCPAHVLTKDGVVAVRIAAHTHPFHDKKILKKIRAGAVYSAITDAQEQGQNIRDGKATDTINDISE